jgi:hypothetical protein
VKTTNSIGCHAHNSYILNLTESLPLLFRTKFKGATVTAYVAGVSNKSFAQRHETLIQNLFKKEGYTVEADTDSKRTHHSWDPMERSMKD